MDIKEIIQESAESILRKSIIKMIAGQVMTYLITKLPLFGVAVINPIIAFFITKIVKVIVENTELGLAFIMIDIRNKKLADEFDKASNKYDEVKNNGSIEDKQKAEADLINSFRDFVRFNK